MTQSYLTSDTGKVYTMLAHAAGGSIGNDGAICVCSDVDWGSLSLRSQILTGAYDQLLYPP
jgi:hypothetical protein